MNRLSILCGVLLGFLLIACDNETDPEIPVAQASIYQVETLTDSTYETTSTIMGNVILEDIPTGGIKMTISMSGLTPNFRHAIHIHMGNCEQPGHHWNQGVSDSFCNATSLGVTWAKPKAGDVGNINTDENGNGELVVESDLWAVNTLDHRDVSGAVIIIHERGEDFVGECFGNHNHEHAANPKIACGSIEPSVTLNN